MATDLPRPAFYALRPGGWRDYVTLLHPPYTAWHLSYVVIGAGVSPAFDAGRAGAALVAFFLAVGIGAHALDELRGRPLRTDIPSPVLVALAAASIGGAVAIGAVAAALVDPWIGVFVAAGAFLVLAYNLELARGRFHTDAWFALAWGAFPVLTGAFASGGTIRAEAALAALFATALSLAQRRLSTQVRTARRSVRAVHGRIERPGGEEELTRAHLVDAPEAALRLLAVSAVLLACSLAALRAT